MPCRWPELAKHTALDAADVFVKTELTPVIETIKRKQNKFCNALSEATRIDDAPGARGTDDPAKPTGPTA